MNVLRKSAWSVVLADTYQVAGPQLGLIQGQPCEPLLAGLEDGESRGEGSQGQSVASKDLENFYTSILPVPLHMHGPTYTQPTPNPHPSHPHSIVHSAHLKETSSVQSHFPWDV